LKYRTFKEAITFAIDREKEAISVYDLFSKRATKPATKAMFVALVEEERRHEQILTGLTPEQLAHVPPRPVTGGELSAAQIKFDPDMDFVAAIKLAIQREEEAVKLYQMLHDESDDPTLKKLFAALVAQEQGHRAKLSDEQDSIVLKDY
jgi:rubrerythrin